MQSLGKHEYQLERDICLITIKGDFTLPEIVDFHEILQAALARHRHLYVIGNMRDAGSIRPEGRRWITKWHQQHRISGVALFGSNFMTRAMWTLLIRAINLLRPHELALAAVATENDARAWVEARLQLGSH